MCRTCNLMCGEAGVKWQINAGNIGGGGFGKELLAGMTLEPIRITCSTADGCEGPRYDRVIRIGS